MNELEKAVSTLITEMENKVNSTPAPYVTDQMFLKSLAPLKKALEKPATMIRCANGLDRMEVELAKVQIPDLWHVAQAMDEPQKSMTLECWHLAHDLLLNLRGDV